MIICPACKALVQEEYYTGGVVLCCEKCGLYLMLPYPSEDNSSTAAGSVAFSL